MTTFYDASRLSARAGGLKISPLGALTDGTLAARLAGYKTGTARRLFALTADEMSSKLPDGGDLLVSRKLDGECNFLYHTKDETVILSPTGRVIAGSAAGAEARKRLLKAKVERALIPGELYVSRGEGRERAHDVPRALADGAAQELVAGLRFAAYDLIEAGTEQALGWPYERRLAKLVEWLGDKPGPAHVVPTEVLKGTAAVKALYERLVGEGGAEGLVVRGEQPIGWKVKPHRTLDVAICGYVEGREDKSGTIRELLVALVRPGGLLHILGTVGTGFSEEERMALLHTLKALDTTSEYVETNRNYFAFQMVRPELVIEVRVTDLLAEDGRGRPQQQMVLRYDDAQGAAPALRIVRKMALASLIHPVFLRLRDDKQVTEHDCRLAQVTDHLVVPDADVQAAPLQMQPSTVLRREVYVKDGKGGQAVRKLLVWRTNKDQADPMYPAYVLHYTDYSPGRADPLQREVRVAPTEAGIQLLAEELLKENIKKGWTPA